MPPHVRRRRARRRSNTPRHAVPARAGLSLGRSQRLMKAKCVALIEFCKRLMEVRCMAELLKLLADPERPALVASGVADKDVGHAPPLATGDGASSSRQLRGARGP